MMPSLKATHPQAGVADRTCDTLQTAHPGWLVFHNPQSGLWSAYRHALSGRPTPGAVLLVRADSAEELDRKLTAQTPAQTPAQVSVQAPRQVSARLSAQASPLVPPSIRAVAAARALQARTAHAVRAGWAGQRPVGLRRLLRS
ncbi:hypothetical protein [Streptosporangium saharense]|uniref:Uncharacterized protein n=1 Tax=Streptosporangium saharense TaxID=1706840 RepID=A0A7W7VJX6_9ACTN|nr:hypothetical protein [Streptosporangium saharense]MBB4912973.1 hypothetical protein [Streptosporangium saharense]